MDEEIIQRVTSGQMSPQSLKKHGSLMIWAWRLEFRRRAVKSERKGESKQPACLEEPQRLANQNTTEEKLKPALPQ